MSILLSLLLAGATGSPAYVPSFDPGEHKNEAAARQNEVLVLGSPHLSGLPDGFDPNSLGRLLERLAAWKPDIITIEAVSGPQCDQLRRYGDYYSDAAESYCPDASAAQKALGIDMAAATKMITDRLANWPERPNPADRRQLAALFLAGGEPASALVQWLRLPESERREGDGLDPAAVTRLGKLMKWRNENNLIGAVLAARLGLERVYAIDDHTADAVNASIDSDAGYGEALQRAWDNPATARRLAEDKRLEAKLDQDGVMALFRALNRPDAAETTYESDFGAALADPSPQSYGRRYAGSWEVRNLRMVANIRAAIVAHPGSRTLSIVGASHKGYFEAYLNMMHDVVLVDAEAVLDGGGVAEVPRPPQPSHLPTIPSGRSSPKTR